MRNLWINGRSVTGQGDVQSAIDPATGQSFAEASLGSIADAEEAVQAGKVAFMSWRSTPANQRAALLHELARKLRARRVEIATELTRESGRTQRKNLGYVEWSAECFDYYAELGRQYAGRVIPSPESSQLSLVIKAPLGVVAAIIPWNYPLLLLAWKLAPALAAGNTVVIKPAEYTTWVTLGFADLFDHFPPGVINIVSGRGSVVGEYLVNHPDVRMIAFTGSTEVGRHIMRRAADDMKHIHLELGGKDPLIVCADAELEAAAQAAVWGGFLNAGQVCTSIERVYVEQAVYPQFLERVIELSSRLVVGPGIEAATEVTPMIRASEREKVDAQVKAALAAGAQLCTGGGIPVDRPDGFFYQPTVLSNIPEDADVMHEETFGPVLPIVPVADFDEAMQRANSSQYGLGATLFTTDARKVKTYMQEIEAGNVWVNDPLIDNLAGPFGGMKRSGIGRELGIEGFEEFFETKHVHWEIEGGRKAWWYPWEREG